METTRWVRKLAEIARLGRRDDQPIVLPDPITMPVSAVKPRPVAMKRTTLPFEEHSTPSPS